MTELAPTERSSPYVTVTFTSTRASLEALLAKEHLFPQTYTDLGIGWSNMMQAIHDALGDQDDTKLVPLAEYRALYDAVKAVRDYRQNKPGTSLQSSYDLDAEMKRADQRLSA